MEHKVCDFLKKNSQKLKSLGSVYHLTSATKLLGEECKVLHQTSLFFLIKLSLSLSLSPQVTVPEEKIKELTPKELNSSSLYFLAASMANLGKKSK